jgi:hypothetical protein
MNHLDEEQLTLACYGEIDAPSTRHLDGCAECKAHFQGIKNSLDTLPEYPVFERGDAYGGEVWVRLLPKLRFRPHISRFRWWIVAPAFATLIAVAFLAGMLTQRHRQPAAISSEARERVLLMAMSDHLDRSQVLLTELSHAGTGGVDLKEEQSLARDLLSENRLLRESARGTGEMSRIALLDDLERVLLDVANSPASLDAADLDTLQGRIQGNDLLFKVRIMSANTRLEGQKL